VPARHRGGRRFLSLFGRVGHGASVSGWPA
jgi:hypothetical protein